MRSRHDLMRMSGDEKNGWDARTAALLEVLLDIRDLLSKDKQENL